MIWFGPAFGALFGSAVTAVAFIRWPPRALRWSGKVTSCPPGCQIRVAHWHEKTGAK